MDKARQSESNTVYSIYHSVSIYISTFLVIINLCASHVSIDTIVLPIVVPLNGPYDRIAVSDINICNHPSTHIFHIYYM